MAPFNRRFYFYKRRPRWRRRYTTRYRRRGLRKTFRRRPRRRRVRKFKFRIKKKLKKLHIQQWQPRHIKKCHIRGFLPLFTAGKGSYSNNYTLYKNSFVPPKIPGGGGWSLQQITLKTLYEENEIIQNWWTKSNRGLPLCRYVGCRMYFFRQPATDYIVTYSIEYPFNVTKYYYQSMHPMRLLTYKHKVVVPSFRTQPLNRRTYKTKYIKPPKELKNEWYFQQNFAKTPLVLLATTACDLTSMYVPTNAENNNAGFWALNTKFFQNRGFRYPHATTGYSPSNNQYIYALQNGPPDITNEIRKNVIFLGDTMLNDPGDPRGTESSYPQAKWGNIFYYKYLTQYLRTFISQENVSTFLNTSKVNTTVGSSVQLKIEPYVHYCRYNPFRDTGKGNMAYWLDVYTANTGWDPPANPDLIVKDLPLWILLWGWEDYTRTAIKLHNMDIDYVLVIKSSFIDPPLPAYILLSDSFVHGEGPYHKHPDEIDFSDYKEWHPKWEFQKEAVESLLSVGPGVVKSENQKQIQAIVKYDFLFKWGGNPADMENVYDPLSQPIYPTPSTEQKANEIDDPETNFTNYIQEWDVRRDILTQTATNRIKKDSSHEFTVFTDGRTTATTSITTKAPKTQTQTTQEETEETLLHQLLQLQQHNNKLEQRFRQLKTVLENTL